jgi:hypothetical protein
VYGPSGELPNQPSVDGSEQQIALMGTLQVVGVLPKDPGEFRAREVGIEEQACSLAKELAVVAIDFGAIAGGALVLPNNRGVYGLTRSSFPYHGGFPLVGDAHCCHFARVHTGHYGLHSLQLGHPNLLGIVFYPTLPREVLGEFALGGGHGLPVRIEQQGSRAAGAGIEC